jgi:hypothetical protein
MYFKAIRNYHRFKPIKKTRYRTIQKIPKTLLFSIFSKSLQFRPIKSTQFEALLLVLKLSNLMNIEIEYNEITNNTPYFWCQNVFAFYQRKLWVRFFSFSFVVFKPAECDCFWFFVCFLMAPQSPAKNEKSLKSTPLNPPQPNNSLTISY